jgi:hypothetical protein
VKGLTKNLHEIYLEFSHFLKKVYPDFVTSSPNKLNGIPVFTFHTIRPWVFKEQLEFLKENNYVTVGIDEFYNYLIGKSPLPEKAILLTIDDGRKSVWTYGFPLLKEFGFRATVFIIPGHTKDKVEDSNPPSPPFNSPLSKGGYRGVEGGMGGFEDIEGESGDKEILSWQEILVMRDSGLIDFGSHTLYHNRIFTGHKIVDFFGSDYDIRPYDYPAVPHGLEVSIIEDTSKFFGMPIYSNDSIMAGKPRFIDDPELREECMRYYRESFGNPPIPPLVKGGEGGLWKKEMFRFSKEYRKKNSVSEKFTTLEDIAKEIYDNLYESKRIIEERLGKPINHLCYSFGIWSNLSIEMAKKSGFATSFCAYIPGRSTNMPGDDTYKIVRLKDDYIFRLPGKGRKSLSEIFLFKMKRRLKGERVY